MRLNTKYSLHLALTLSTCRFLRMLQLNEILKNKFKIDVASGY